MGTKQYVIKCYKCKTKFEGTDFAAIVSDNNIKKDMRGYYCDCKVIEDIAMQPKRKTKRFGLEEFGQ